MKLNFRGTRRQRSRALLLFFIIIQGVVVLLFGSRLYLIKPQGAWENISIRIYSRILEITIPGYMYMQKEQADGIWADVTFGMCPSYAIHEKMMWYENQPEELLEQENLLALQNQIFGEPKGKWGRYDSYEEFVQNAEGETVLAKAKDYLKQVKNLQAEENVARGEEIKENKEESNKGSSEDRRKEESQALSVTEEELTEDRANNANKKKINRQKLKDFDYLVQNFYQIDHTTTVTKKVLDVEKLLAYDLQVKTAEEGPQILIYHTHSQEGYQDSISGDSSTTVVGVGNRLTKLLEQKGFRVLHNTDSHDIPERDHAYSTAAPRIEEILKENPSIEVVIDLHRDGVREDLRLVTEQNGKEMAQLMFFNGLSHTTTMGDIPYLKNPYIQDNLAFSLQAQIVANENYPGLMRRIYLKGYRFNMHFCPKTLLVEVGAQTNTLEEAKNAMEPLADILEKVLNPK